MNDAIRLARIFKVLSVPARVRIAQLLKGRVLCVNALAAQLEVTQGAVSQHLRVMRDAGLVTDEKRGYYVHYRLNDKTLDEWREAVVELLDPTRGAVKVKEGGETCAATRRRRAEARRDRSRK
jgi:DNA-binding transcriptional ArsR family regulator